MEQIVNQCVGIDCAKKDFEVSFSVCDASRETKHLAGGNFVNNKKGFKGLLQFAKKSADSKLPLLFVMEATGVYHQHLARFLYDSGFKVSIVAPKRAKDFSKTLMVRSVNDKIAAQYLAVMGLEKKLDLWAPPKEEYFKLRQLTREKERIQKLITIAKNEHEAASHEIDPIKNTIKRLKQQIKFLSEQRKEVVLELADYIKANAAIKEEVAILTSIPGVGEATAACILSETEGFSHTSNRRQIVSYAGYDVINHMSGTSINTKASISKKGNKHIRKGLHMAALCSIRHDKASTAKFTRIVSKTSIKMKGVVAIQRKLLVLCYTLLKTKKRFDPDYEEKKGGDVAPPRELDLVRS